MRHIVVSAIWVGIFSLCAGAVAHANDDEGARLAAACAACHRLDGRNTGIPPIVGMDPRGLADAMRAFRSDEGPNHLMHAVSLTLTDAEVLAIARHLAALSPRSKTP